MKTFFIKKLVFAAILIVALDGCKKDDPDPGCYLSVLQGFTDGDLVFTNTYHYDGGRATGLTNKTVTEVIEATYNYDGDNISQIDYDAGYSDIIKYTDGNITRVERRSFPTGTLTGLTDFEYTGEQLVKIQTYSSAGASPAKGDYRTYTYDNTTTLDPAGLSFFNGATSTTPAYTATFTYGTKKSALSQVPPAVLKYLRLGGQSVEKNIVKIEFSTGEMVEYSYGFNLERNVPMNRSETYKNAGVTNTINYAYTCD